MTAAELASIRIGFIGAGQMARALACGFVGSGLVEGDQLRAADTVAFLERQASWLADGRSFR